MPVAAFARAAVVTSSAAFAGATGTGTLVCARDPDAGEAAVGLDLERAQDARVGRVGREEEAPAGDVRDRPQLAPKIPVWQAHQMESFKALGPGQGLNR